MPTGHRADCPSKSVGTIIDHPTRRGWARCYKCGGTFRRGSPIIPISPKHPRFTGTKNWKPMRMSTVMCQWCLESVGTERVRFITAHGISNTRACGLCAAKLSVTRQDRDYTVNGKKFTVDYRVIVTEGVFRVHEPRYGVTVATANSREAAEREAERLEQDPEYARDAFRAAQERLESSEPVVDWDSLDDEEEDDDWEDDDGFVF